MSMKDLTCPECRFFSRVWPEGGGFWRPLRVGDRVICACGAVSVLMPEWELRLATAAERAAALRDPEVRTLVEILGHLRNIARAGRQ